MRCRDFLESLTDAVDGADDPALLADWQAHEAACPSCARYARVVREGCRLARTLPDVDLSSNFHARLDHRLLHVEDELRRLHGQGLISGASLATALGVALVLAMIVWGPILEPEPPQVALPALVASPPAARSPLPVLRPTLVGGRLDLGPMPTFEADLWKRSRLLPYEYSALRARYDGPPTLRAGLQ